MPQRMSARAAQNKILLRRNHSYELITCKTGKKRSSERKINERKQMMGGGLKSALECSKYFIVLQYNDIHSHEWNNIRYTLQQHDIKVKVFPTKLSVKVLEETRYQGLGHLFRGSVVTCSSEKDNLKDFVLSIKTMPKLDMLGGIVDDKLLSKNQVIEYSDLPPLDTLRSELLAHLQQPSLRLMDVIEKAQKSLVMSLEHYANPESNTGVSKVL
eukprot:gene17846-19628_t